MNKRKQEQEILSIKRMSYCNLVPLVNKMRCLWFCVRDLVSRCLFDAYLLFKFSLSTCLKVVKTLRWEDWLCSVMAFKITYTVAKCIFAFLYQLKVETFLFKNILVLSEGCDSNFSWTCTPCLGIWNQQCEPQMLSWVLNVLDGFQSPMMTWEVYEGG